MKSYLALAGGVTEVTRQRALAAARALVAQGEATAEQVTTLAEDLLAQTRQNREAVAALVGYEVDRALGRVGLASADEVAALTERVRALESRLPAAGSAGAGSAGSASSPAKKAPGRTAAARTPGPGKSASEKSGAKKSAAKKAPTSTSAAKTASAPTAGA